MVSHGCDPQVSTWIQAQHVYVAANFSADSQVKLEYLVRELGSMRFANFLVVRVELPGYRGAFC